MTPTRRDVLTTFATLGGASLIVARPVRASETPIELDWADLIPKQPDGSQTSSVTKGVVRHGQMSTPGNLTALNDVTTEYRGKTVRLPGFAVPLDYASVGVTSLLLVPYVGACIHVPPPPNQLVLVTTNEP